MISIYSPNMLKTFKQSQRKFYVKYVKNISMTVNDSFFEFGKNIHALASYYLRKENIIFAKATVPITPVVPIKKERRSKPRTAPNPAPIKGEPLNKEIVSTKASYLVIAEPSSPFIISINLSLSK